MIYDLDSPVKALMFGKVTQPASPWNKGYKTPINIVLYCTEGVLHMAVNGRPYHLHPGDVLLIPEQAFYKPLEGGRCQYVFFHMEATRLPDTAAPLAHVTAIPHTGLAEGFGYTYTTTERSLVDVPLFVRDAPPNIRELFARAGKLKPGRNVTDKLLMDHLLRELLIRMAKPPAPPHSRRFTDITDYISTHYAEPLTLSTLAEQFALSPSYIARLFRIEAAMKPSEYIHRVRLSAAKTLLLETDLPIKDIAEKTGYADTYYFSKTFKRFNGLSPLRMRNGQ